MKHLIILMLAVALTGCSEEKKEVDSNMVNNTASAKGKAVGDVPEMTFDETEFDFGRISQGEIVSHQFYFENTGNRELIITGAEGSCGCTVPEWPRGPIAPGKREKINVVFRSEGKKDYQEKTVTVVTNCEPATKVVRIKAMVVVAETAK